MIKNLLLATGVAWILALSAFGIWLGLPYLPDSLMTRLAPTIDPWQLPLKVLGHATILTAPIITLVTAVILLNAKRWQRKNNERLGTVGVYHWIAVPKSEKGHWSKSAADIWRRMRTALLRSDSASILGRAPYASLEVMATHGHGIAWGLWAPDVRHLPKRTEAQDLPDTLANMLKGSAARSHVARQDDPIRSLKDDDSLRFLWVELRLQQPSHYPIRTQFDTDPLLPIIAAFKTDQMIQTVGMQVIVRPVGGWSSGGRRELGKLIQNQAETKRGLLTAADKEKRLRLEEKLDQTGYDVVLRFFVAGVADVAALDTRLKAVMDVIGQYQSSFNGFAVAARGHDTATLINRAFSPRLAPKTVLNVGELAALYHLPNHIWAPINEIKWAPSAILPPSTPVIVAWGMPSHLQENEA